MDVFSISQGSVLLSSYDGSIQLADSRLKTVSMLTYSLEGLGWVAKLRVVLSCACLTDNDGNCFE